MFVTVKASGWRRNKDRERTVGFVDLEEAEVVQGRASSYPFDKPTVELGPIGTTITWNRQLSLQGDYAVSVELDEETIGQLFKWKFGDEITPATLEQLGVHLSAECLRTAVSNMTLRELVGLIAP